MSYHNRLYRLLNFFGQVFLLVQCVNYCASWTSDEDLRNAKSVYGGRKREMRQHS